MKVMQINTWQGRLLRPLLAFIEAENPDIIFTQEIYNFPIRVAHTSPWNYFDNTARITAQNNFADTYFSAASTFPMFDHTLEYGNAIFSKYPVTATSTHYTGGTGPQHLKTADVFDGNLGRHFQHVVIIGPAGPINLINHHGHWVNQPLGNEVSVAKLQAVATYINELSGPIIFAGDLNLSPASDTIQAFLKSTGLSNPRASTDPAVTSLSTAHYVKKPIVCDYILTRGQAKIIDFKISEALVSDHRALIAQIDA